MTTRVIPAEVALAAKRGFIRTTYQAYAATLSSATVTAGTILSVIDNPEPKVLIATALAAVLTPPLAGLVSYFSITSRGIPGDYRAAVDQEVG